MIVSQFCQCQSNHDMEQQSNQLLYMSGIVHLWYSRGRFHNGRSCDLSFWIHCTLYIYFVYSSGSLSLCNDGIWQKCYQNCHILDNHYHMIYYLDQYQSRRIFHKIPKRVRFHCIHNICNSSLKTFRKTELVGFGHLFILHLCHKFLPSWEKLR